MKLLLVVLSYLILHAQAQSEHEVDEQLFDEADYTETENPEALEVMSSEKVSGLTTTNVRYCLTPCSCGVPNPIVAGAVTPLNRFPWALQLTTIPAGSTVQRFICGATLINSKNALASASCFRNINTPVYARIIRLVGSQVRGYIRSVAIIRHPAFNQTNLFADLAMLKFNTSIPLGNGLVPICLTAPTYQFTGRNGYTAAWGHQAGGLISNSVRVNIAPIISNQACSTINPNRRIFYTMLCAGPYVANRNSGCQSDYGGPLSVIDRSRLASGAVVNRHKLAGVGSFGYGCISQARAPGVYTRTSLFRNFIYANSLDGCFCPR